MTEKKSGNILDGSEAIAAALDRSYTTLMNLKRRYPEMPMKKDPSGNRWVAEKERLLDWWQGYLLSDQEAMSKTGLNKKELVEQEALRNPQPAAAGGEGSGG